MLTYYMQFDVSFRSFWPITRIFVKSNEVAQFNAKFLLTLNWTLLRLFDFKVIAQIIVKFVMDLTNTRLVYMLVMKNTA